MGLFSGLLGKGAEALDVQTAVMVPIVAAMLADGEIEDSEIGQIRSICVWSPIYARNSPDRDTEVIRRAIRRVQQDRVEHMCRAAADLLSPALRETSFVFAVRMVFADGHVGVAEETLIERLTEWLDVDGARARGFVETVSVMQHTADA